ncbi:MAG: hypothetical protein HKN17_04605 [Rhodothermales bacterium]|nr:hypothetical protein [Rhodothermales bacterium]
MRYALHGQTALLVGALILASGCSEPTETMVDGDCQSVYGGDICTYGVVLGDDVVEFGATVPLASIENAPLDEEPVFPPPFVARIALPDEVRSGIGIDHLALNWEVVGHPPRTFLTPHFDFHFYTTDARTVDGIDCSDTLKPDVIPAGYDLPDFPIPDTDITLVGLCVPGMGMHAANAEEAAATDPFEATMVVGYYSGEPIFVEPMITRDLMMTRQDFSLAVPSVDSAPNFPASFDAVYDEASDSYRLKFRM